MTEQITPDERADVRKHAEGGNSLWPAEALRLLDALDTAEAEVARLRAAEAEATRLRRDIDGSKQLYDRCDFTCSMGYCPHDH